MPKVVFTNSVAAIIRQDGQGVAIAVRLEDLMKKGTLFVLLQCLDRLGSMRTKSI